MALSRRNKQLVGRYALLAIAGMALQLFLGDVDASFLFYPWTIIVAINYLYILILFYVKSDSVKCLRRLYDRPAMLSSLASMLVLTLLFGLIRQDGSTDGFWGWLGFTRMTSSWIFILFLVHFTTVIGLKAVEDVHRWKQRRLPVVLMHASSFVILASAIVSSGEKVRVRVTTAIDAPISMGVTEDRRVYELPFTLTLKEFILEEYPPQVVVVDGREMVMPRREVKKFLSRVAVTDDDGTEEVEILVNHPARIGVWRIYQSGYDSSRGKDSTISILECVKDGWYPAIHVAMWLILIAGAWMMFGGWKVQNKKKEDKS
ncbi:MAG: cytochrome c biogenesis protein ResB [Bacteroides sp.]|nr:cytochrome c biogenesis protein ResB [Bacteroides sp.]